MEEFLPSSIDIQKKLTKKFRAKHGIFLTPKSLREALFDHIDIVPRNVLEPSCGSGEFLVDCERRFPNAGITGVELNDGLVSIARSNVSRTDIVQSDFLDYKCDRKFDLIIGNPPFARVAKKNCRYPEAILLRSNLYIEILYKCLAEHLERDGVLAMILPATIQNGASFQLVRNTIISMNVVHFEVIREHEFKDTKAGVCLLVVQNTAGNNERFEFDGILTGKSRYIRDIVTGCKTFSEYDLNILSYNATHLLKPYHSRDRDDIEYVLSRDLHDRDIVFDENKRLYIKRDVPSRTHSGNVVFISRTMSTGATMGGTYQFKFAKFYSPEFLYDMSMYAISGADIDIFYESLKDERTNMYLEELLGSGALNINTLRKLPIFR
jgi:tRNA1(Val) A37 N6-methylase TrmN6